METKYTRKEGGRFVRRRAATGSWRFDQVRAQGFSGTQITAAAASVIETPLLDDLELGVDSAGWIVTVFDNDYNSYEQVMAILMIATACTAEEAYTEAWEIDHLGKSVVHYASEKECREAAEVICKIGIKVTVSEE